jgi:hypothetical protein
MHLELRGILAWPTNAPHKSKNLIGWVVLHGTIVPVQWPYRAPPTANCIESATTPMQIEISVAAHTLCDCLGYEKVLTVWNRSTRLCNQEHTGQRIFHAITTLCEPQYGKRQDSHQYFRTDHSVLGYHMCRSRHVLLPELNGKMATGWERSGLRHGGRHWLDYSCHKGTFWLCHGYVTMATNTNSDSTNHSSGTKIVPKPLTHDNWSTSIEVNFSHQCYSIWTIWNENVIYFLVGNLLWRPTLSLLFRFPCQTMASAPWLRQLPAVNGGYPGVTGRT